MLKFFRANDVTAEDILSRLLEARPDHTRNAPKDSRGVYGLIDHLGELRYIGSTKATNETFYKRIHGRHRTGSEDSSHYFSRMYNTGRMWRRRNDPSTKADGDVAKTLRNAFIAQHCRAVWVPIADDLDIASLEHSVIGLAPRGAIAWNRRGMDAYAEPIELVDSVITGLGFGAAEMEAINRQNGRFGGGEIAVAPSGRVTASASESIVIPAFPKGPFRFLALDVETANNDRASICQIGVACVRPDNSIETWVTFIDPRTSDWSCTRIHGIRNETVRGAPHFEQVLPVLEQALEGHLVYQHSSFDRSAVAAACRRSGLAEPRWDWRDSVQVARQAWPELRGNGGHGLASLKMHLGLDFEHHDAGEDARASAEVVLRAEADDPGAIASPEGASDDFEVLEDIIEPLAPKQPDRAVPGAGIGQVIGRVRITEGNIKNNHIYLRSFFSAFPKDAVGGSNIGLAATRTISVHWGGSNTVVTDLDGQKMFFRKRGWIREFFATGGVAAGDEVVVACVGPYAYRVAVDR